MQGRFASNITSGSKLFKIKIMSGKEIFSKIADCGDKFFSSILMLRDNKDYKDANNNMFQSSEVGSVCNNNVSVYTTTVKTQDGPVSVTHDAVVLSVFDCCDDDVEVLLSKQDCIDLMAYLSAATFALRD